MTGQTGGSQKKQPIPAYKNTFEAIKSLGSSVVKNTGDEFKKIGTGFFDQLTGNYETYEKPEDYSSSERRKPGLKQESSLFNYREYYERSIVKRQIQELTEQIKKEIAMVKKADKSLMYEVREAEKLTVGELPEKPGIYHVRFLELLLNFIKLLRTKINESGTWLAAMISRKKKRGSLFAHLAKKKGTQYSLSQELQLTRQTG